MWDPFPSSRRSTDESFWTAKTSRNLGTRYKKKYIILRVAVFMQYRERKDYVWNTRTCWFRLLPICPVYRIKLIRLTLAFHCQNFGLTLRGIAVLPAFPPWVGGQLSFLPTDNIFTEAHGKGLSCCLRLSQRDVWLFKKPRSQLTTAICPYFLKGWNSHLPCNVRKTVFLFVLQWNRKVVAKHF